jgi:hypothetical protein
MRGELIDDIRVTSENVIADARSITEIEERKLDPNVTGEELTALSEEAAALANDLAKKAAVEKRLVAAANAQDRLSQAAQRVPHS